ncbi:penicillin-binding protein 2 [Candidatus Uhrbacteria bacterium]|nr:penicillin-binding protein 2 [Candidatus Uhrbacteria bacterium]
MFTFRKKYKVGSKRDTDASLYGRRIRIMRIVVLCLFAVFGARLFTIQVMGYDYYRSLADDEHQFFKKLVPTRGEIFLRERNSDTKSSHLLERNGAKLFPAVTNREYKLLYAVPKLIIDPEKTAETLAPILEMEKEELLKKMSNRTESYRVLKRKVSDETYEHIRALELPGISFNTEVYRFYPEKGLGGHVFGFLGYDAKNVFRGLYGLEGYFHDTLKGKEGSLKVEKDAFGTFIPVGDKKIVDAVNGSSLILTIERTVQLVACDRLTKWVAQHGADGGSIIITEPKTGSILAMCNTPDFDPEQYSKSEPAVYSNKAIFTPFEPGSTFKAITMAMALDMDVVTPQTTYVDTGAIKIGSYTIKNSDLKAHGTQTMMNVLDNSLNTGAIYVARKVGLENFKKYMKAFGFGTRTGIELDSESTGNMKALDDKNEIYLATSSFGQGITVTPLQLVMAYGALANGGKLMQPYIVDEIIKPDGTSIKTKPKVIRQAISERASTLVGGMLVNVVRKGHGQRAGVPYYYVAGKTGTAQVPKKNGRGYEKNVTIGSFVGFAPVDDPQFAMLVKIDHPRSVQWAESSAAPLFGDLAHFLLNYYEVPPDEK